MWKLKKVSCVHESKDNFPLTLSATFVGMTAWGACSLRVMLSPDKEQEELWQTLEHLIQKTVRQNMKSQSCHDVEEFYPEDPECTCNSAIASIQGLHLKDCPVYQEATP